MAGPGHSCWWSVPTWIVAHWLLARTTRRDGYDDPAGVLWIELFRGSSAVGISQHSARKLRFDFGLTVRDGSELDCARSLIIRRSGRQFRCAELSRSPSQWSLIHPGGVKRSVHE
jgi:hypothetical protein